MITVSSRSADQPTTLLINKLKKYIWTNFIDNYIISVSSMIPVPICTDSGSITATASSLAVSTPVSGQEEPSLPSGASE